MKPTQPLLLLAALLAAYGPAANAVQFNTEALQNMQQQGQQIVEDAKALRTFTLPTGMCLHLKGDLTKAGSNVVIENCKADLNNQKWRFDDAGRLVNQGGLCLGVAGDATKPGANAVIQQCSDGKQQKWKLDDSKRLVNDLDKCLNAVGDAKTPGGNVVSTNCNRMPNQIWN